MNPQLFPFTPADQHPVAHFWVKIYQEMGWPTEDIQGSDDIPAFFHFPQGCMWLWKDSEKIVGCGGVKPLTETTAIVKRFHIAPELRGKGFAADLLFKLIKEAKKLGFTRIVLDVYYQNPRAARFYQKHGFTPYTQEPDPHWPESAAQDKFFFYELKI